MLYSCCKAANSTESLNADITGEPVLRTRFNFGVREGFICFITGQLLRHGDRFIIDFTTDNICKDIALRLGVRACTLSLGRNSLVKRKWSLEETALINPFSLVSGRNFEVQVFFTVKNIFIAFDGLHVAEYVPHLPINVIRSVEVRGDITDLTVGYEVVTFYPFRRRSTLHVASIRKRNAETAEVEELELDTVAVQLSYGKKCLPSPYYATFREQSIKQGYSIVVRGQVCRYPNAFKVALQVGQNIWPQPNVAVQVEFRFTDQNGDAISEPIIAVNSFADAKWAEEVQPEFKSGLRPEATFTLTTIHGKGSFDIYLNDNLVCKYPYAVSPLCVNTCFIEGDISLVDVGIGIAE